MGYVFDLGSVLSGKYLDWFLIGLATTLALTAAAWCLAMAMGIVLTLIRMIPFPPFGWFVALYVEYHRNVPLLVQIFVWYFGVPSLLPRPARQWINAHHGEFLLAMIALGLAAAAYVAEDIRSGIRSIPRAQYEAARSIGFGYLGTMRYVVLPQAIRNVLPDLVSNTVEVVKLTSIASVVALPELLRVARDAQSLLYNPSPIVLAALIYLAILWPLVRWLSRLEHKTMISR